MPEWNPLDDLFIADAAGAIRYLVFRAEHRIGRWANVRTIDQGLSVSLRITPADEETGCPEEIDAAVSHSTRTPSTAELYEVERWLVHLGLIPSERTERSERRAVVIRISRAEGYVTA